MDYAHKKTDKELKRIEKEIVASYKAAMKNIQKELDKVLLKINLEDDPTKIYNLVMQQKRFQILLKDMTEEINKANETAVKIMNDSFLDTYTLNSNWESFNIEKQLGYELDFTVLNKNVVKELLKKNSSAFELLAINNLKDKSIILSKLRTTLLTSLLQGYSIDKIAKEIQSVVGVKGYEAIRIARTETTRIQNVARLESMRQAEEMGLNIEKRWIATGDARTRTSHMDLNGETVPLNKQFSNGCNSPGDGGTAAEVVNCRCTMTTEFVDIKKSKKEMQLDKNINSVFESQLTFDKWLKNKNDQKS